MSVQSMNVQNIILQRQMLTIETKSRLSTLWIVYLFNTIFRDLHEFVEPGFIEGVMTGTFNGVKITEELLLLGGFMAAVPISMVLLSQLLPYGANRWTNIIAAVINLAFDIMNGTSDLDDTFHLIIKIATLSLIIWSVWQWRNPYLKQPKIDQRMSSQQW